MIADLLVNTLALLKVDRINADEGKHSKPGKKIRFVRKHKIWQIILFSLRDVFAVSIREPQAYMQSPSDVTHQSIRDWNRVTLRCLIFLLEGLIGAWLIEHFYPCGSHYDVFHYIGWMCLTSLILSVTLLTLISDLLHPNHLLEGDKAFNRSFFKTMKLLFCTSIVSSSVFGLTQQRTPAERWAIILVMITHLIMTGIISNTYFNSGTPTTTICYTQV